MSFPEFFQHAPTVPTHDALAQLLGSSDGGFITYRYEDAVRLAGHSCPTVAGAFLMARAAMVALFPDGPAERGHIAVRMPAPQDHRTIGVMAQVFTPLTGAAAANGFHGIAGRHVRKGLLSYAEQPDGDEVRFTRVDTGAGVTVSLDLSTVPIDPAQHARFAAILSNRDDTETGSAFAHSWQDRVRRLLLEHADDPEVIVVRRLAA